MQHFERLAVEYATDVLSIVDPDGRRRYVSPAARWVLGYEPAALVGRRVAEHCHPADWDKLQGALAALWRGSDRETIDVRFRRSCGSYVWCESTVQAVRDDATGRLDLIVTVTRDITERKRTQQAVQLLRAIVAAANWASDLESPLRVALDELCAFTGWELGRVYLPREDGRLVPAGWWHAAGAGEEHVVRLQAALDEPVGPGEGLAGRVLTEAKPHVITDLHLDGEFGPLVLGAAPAVQGAVALPVLVGDEVAAVLEFFALRPAEPDSQVLYLMDQVGLELGRVFERQRTIEAERRKVEAERRFLAMLTHDLRSPLTAVVGFAELLRSGWDRLPTDRCQRSVEQIVTQASRIRALIDDFLLTSRLESGVLEPDPEPLDLAAAADAAVTDLRDVVGEVEVRAGRARCMALADPRFVRQILDNLLTNAAKYGEPPVVVEVGPGDGGMVRVRVCDRGPGVPDDFVPAIFDRFTRGDRDCGSGTGLGLAIVRELARALGGTVSYQPREPCGAAFTVELPAATGDPRDSDTSAST